MIAPLALEALDRRAWLKVASAGFAGISLPGPTGKEQGTGGRGKPTQFQIACMTLPYSRFPLQRALTGIKAAGYRYVAWGTTHQEGGTERVPVLADDAPPAGPRSSPRSAATWAWSRC